MEEINPFNSLRAIEKYAPLYARAKMDRTQIADFMKSKLAILYNESDGKTVEDRKNYALSHPEYLELIKGHSKAVEEEEIYKHKLKNAELAISVYQTMSANSRLEARSIDVADRN